MAANDIPATMKAFVVDADGKGVVRDDVPVPVPRDGEALVRVLRAGICNTDIELMRGYKGGFTGILGHEFVGEVVVASSAPEIVGKRVCGELNVSCNSCGICSRGGSLARNHCSRRSVLGILNHDGTYAEFLTLPVSNLHVVPDSISNEAAVFVEPLAAAFRVVEQGLVQPEHRVCVQGDGKLGLLVAEVLARQGFSPKPVLIGRHTDKMALLGDLVQAREASSPEESDALVAELAGSFDVVVEATGTPLGLTSAASLVLPMGTVVLKSTCASPATIDTSPLVVRELKVVGSRCGPFPEAVALLASRDLDVQKYVSAVFPLGNADKALEMAGTRGCLKVQLAVASSEMASVSVREPA